MTGRQLRSCILAWLLGAVPCSPALAVVLGQVDDFEDGTTQNWVTALLGAPTPVPPENVPSGGPGGVDDNYLGLRSIGGGGPGSRLTAMDVSQWAGDYFASGILYLGMDLNNLGDEDLSLRLFFADPQGAPPNNAAISTSAISLPAGSGWVQTCFAILPADLTPLLGSVDGALAGATELRILHNPDPTFPPPPILASLGVDNIRALASVPIPEPPAWLLLAAGGGLLALGALRR